MGLWLPGPEAPRDFPVEEGLGGTDLTLNRQSRAINPKVFTFVNGPGSRQGTGKFSPVGSFITSSLETLGFPLGSGISVYHGNCFY